MSYQEEFMHRAIELAEAGMHANQGGPFGAVVVRDGKIIGEGNNRVTSSNDPTAHAEVIAIRNACNTLESHQLTGCEIYTTCEPCPMCLGAIYWARPDHIYFACTREDAALGGFDDQFIYDELDKDMNKRAIHTKQFMREEARSLFLQWHEKEDKVRY